MIHESSYWKNDLIKLARRLELRLIQTRWADKNFFTIEKEIFVGFYSVRKLIESKKVPDQISNKPYELREFEYRGDPASIVGGSGASDYDLSNAKLAKLTVHQICNQFIHSHHFIPFHPNGKNLIGFFFCSDRQRTSGLYLMTLFDAVEIYRLVGSTDPSTMRTIRRPNGRAITTID